MKVIDLLNKLANGEKIPKRIYWKDYEFINGEFKKGSVYRIMSKFTTETLNEEVEIIEDTPKENKKIEPIKEEVWELNNSIIKNKINEIIDKINKEK